MNVAFDRWIPVVTAAGDRELISLCSALAEGEKYADLAVRPHERVALMRLFFCVAHAALDGPKDYDEWCEVPKKLPEASRKYLEERKDLFELFHPKKPWLQVAELSKNKDGNTCTPGKNVWTSVSKFNFSFATGSNSTLFDHEGAIPNVRNIPLPETVVSMVTFQCFSVGGLIGQVFWGGTRCGELANPKKDSGPVKSADGPCVPSSMIHAFLRGKNLFGSIHLNLNTHEDIRFGYGERDIGKPVWELMPTSLNDTEGINNATETYVGRLVPLTRVIRLNSSGDQMLIGDGFRYPPFSAGFPQEPSATVTVKNEKRALLSYRPSRAIWRELAAVVVKRSAEGIGGPLSLRAMQDGEGYDLVVAALARDKATIVDTIESVFHVPDRLRTPEGVATYEAEVKMAELIASRVGWAVEDYRKEIDDNWLKILNGEKKVKGAWELKAKLHATATTHYWTAIEKNLSLLMSHIEAIGTDDAIPTRKVWRKMLFATACDAYRIACGRETPRQMRAFAKGWQKLTSRKNGTNKNETREKNP